MRCLVSGSAALDAGTAGRSRRGAAHLRGSRRRAVPLVVRSEPIARQTDQRPSLLGALVVSRNRTETRRRPVRKIEEHFVDVTRAPPLRRIIGFDDRVLRCAKMFRSVPVGRLITAADMTTGATDAQMQPRIAQFQAFLTPESARNDVADCARCVQLFVAMLNCPPATP